MINHSSHWTSRIVVDETLVKECLGISQVAYCHQQLPFSSGEDQQYKYLNLGLQYYRSIVLPNCRNIYSDDPIGLQHSHMLHLCSV